jgi:hypothetical protein
MAAIFPRWTNLVPLAIVTGLAVSAPAATFAAWYWFSPEFTDVGYAPVQPIAFSHATHAGKLGMDCRYCHSTVERSHYAAVPPTQTCMNCHAVVHQTKDQTEASPEIAKLLQAYASDLPVHWKRVHLLPDFAFFNHSVHLAAGVGCVSCHGRIDQMERVRQDKTLSMGWCLECHRNPGPNLRPRAEVTNMSWNAKEAGYDWHSDHPRAPAPPEHCSGCHR